MKVEMIYLSQEDVIRCGGMSMDKAIDDLEEVFRLYDKGDYILPGKIVMKRPEPNAEETTGRIHARLHRRTVQHARHQVGSAAVRRIRSSTVCRAARP